MPGDHRGGEFDLTTPLGRNACSDQDVAYFKMFLQCFALDFGPVAKGRGVGERVNPLQDVVQHV